MADCACNKVVTSQTLPLRVLGNIVGRLGCVPSAGNILFKMILRNSKAGNFCVVD